LLASAGMLSLLLASAKSKVGLLQRGQRCCHVLDLRMATYIRLSKQQPLVVRVVLMVHLQT
jgi:hypothetical protein